MLAALMAACVWTVAFAEEKETVLSGNAGEDVTWVLTKDGVLTVSGTGPIKDKTEIEYDEDGNSCTSTIDSISMTVMSYFDEQTGGLSAADTARARFELVKEIVVEEGITEIPQSEFAGMYPVKVTLPSTLEMIGFDAIELLFAEELTVKSSKLAQLQMLIPAYENDAEPYKTLSEAKEDYIKKVAAQEAFDFDMLPFDALITYACVTQIPDEAGWNEMSEEGRQVMMDTYNEYLGTEATKLEDLVPAALQKLNELFGTTYTDVDEIFSLETDEDGFKNLVTDPDLQEKIDAKNEELYDESRLKGIELDAEDESSTVYGWFTITAPAGGEIEQQCKAAGVNFKALDDVSAPEENENLCKFCGEEHSDNLWQKIVGFFHQVLYFFAHLFGMM